MVGQAGVALEVGAAQEVVLFPFLSLFPSLVPFLVMAEVVQEPSEHRWQLPHHMGLSEGQIGDGKEEQKVEVP